MTTSEFSHAADQMMGHLRPFAMKLTRDSDDANDLIQETMMRAFNNVDKFRSGTNMRAWMYTIMKNIFITQYQRKLRKQTFVDTTDNMHFLNTAGKQSPNEAEHNFVVKDVRQAVSKLKEPYRLPLHLHMNGFKYEEIAESMGLPLGTVKNRIHVARQSLQNKLRPYRHYSSLNA